ncbi:MAG: alcohol dehydrogenase catalytic domain-containing protein [Anaerolineae bacterium]|nr:alcohol dehydrogenase catalytic domain-containing protein [Anaerolineae bacterium]
MRQVELSAPKSIRLLDVPRPTPGPGEVLIAVAAVGICGSDLHAYHGKHPFIRLPVVPGHEFAGAIAAVGPEVDAFSVGERVTVEPSLTCGDCYNCTHGRYNICEHLAVIGCQTTGAMADFIVAPADRVFLLPDAVTWEQGAMVEPLAVGIHAVKVAGFAPGASVLILGAGTIGLMTLQAAKAAGAGPVVVTDLLPARLDLALRLGADAAVNPAVSPLKESLEVALGPDRADVIIECVGVGATVRDAINVARKGTRIVLAGVFEELVSVPLGLVQDRELVLAGTLMYADDDFPEAISLLATGKVQAAPLVSHHFALEDAAQAFQAADQRDYALKVILDVVE